MTATTTKPDDPVIISWDIYARALTDGSMVFDVIGTSDACRVTFHCADERSAENLLALIDGHGVTGSLAEPLIDGVAVVEKTCSRCKESWPADREFFRPQPRPTNGARLAPWCRACEKEQKAHARAVAKNAIAKATGETQ